MAEKFQKKKLNRDDHKKMDNAAKYVRKGGVIILGALTTCVIVAKKNGPKIMSAAKNIITKV